MSSINNAINHVICIVCNSPAIIFEESKYNGLRGNCTKCGGNWPES